MEGLRGSPLIASCLAAVLWLGSPPHAQNGDCPETIVFSFDSLVRNGDRFVFPNARFEGCDLTIEADEAVATGLDINRRWALSGSVVMAVGTARISADSAVFEFESGDLVAAELAGDPATFEETAPDGEGPARGVAERIVYDREAATVQMPGSARFTLAGQTVSGCDFVYELDGGLTGGGSNGCGVQLEYVLPSGADSAEDRAEDPETTPEQAPNPAPPSP